MTLRYRLLGIPGNLDEVADKATRHNVIPSVFVQPLIKGATLFPRSMRYAYQVVASVGDREIVADSWEQSLYDKVFDAIDNGELAENRARETAKELSSKCLAVLIYNDMYVDGECFDLSGGIAKVQCLDRI